MVGNIHAQQVEHFPYHGYGRIGSMLVSILYMHFAAAWMKHILLHIHGGYIMPGRHAHVAITVALIHVDIAMIVAGVPK